MRGEESSQVKRRGVWGQTEVEEMVAVEEAENGRGIAEGGAREKLYPRRRNMATDPVCGMKVDDENPEFQTLFAGKRYVFCSEKCQREFEDQPGEYIETAA